MRSKLESALPLGLLFPSVAFLALLIVVPIGQAFLLAFQGETGDFSLSAFQRMVGDTAFNEAVRNTFLLLLAIVPLQIILALAMALVIHTRLRGQTFFLYIFAIPLAISDLAAGLVWLSIFTERGYLNSILHHLGWIQQPILFLSYQNPQGIFSAIVVAEAWRATAIVLVILVAGLQMIPRDYFEAAELFGAGTLKRTWYVVLPLLRPSLQTALIIRTLFAFQTFAVVFALAGRTLPVLAGEAYTWYYSNRNPAVAAAMAFLILLLSLAATIVYLRVLRVREEEVGR